MELLRAGTEAIRKARQANPDLLLDLSGEDLSGIILDGVEIGKANFDNANLTGAS
ncbi:pentapeptide repeat-containing protein, partial [Streptococcus suis]